jgi:aspartyl-tRNA(Asn)/glutamyl-tRNA(Gln) amidotransferase subunit C
MAITLRDVECVAKLARLKLTEEEEVAFQRELDKVVEHMDKLNAVDTGNVPVTSHVIPTQNVLREDRVSPSLSADQALVNAPRSEGGFFRVPKVIG